MQGVERQPHIHLTKADARPVALTCGDPARTLVFAKLCDSYKELQYHREYKSLEATLNGHTFLIVSHGVGASGATICFRELIEIGCKVIIRAGTAGSLQKDRLKRGAIVVCHSAVKEEGVSSLLEPLGIPAVADFDVTQTLLKVGKKLHPQIHAGITLSSDAFYPSKVLPSTLATMRDANVDIVEMEASALFVTGRHHNVKTGCLCVLDGCPFSWEEGDYDPAGTVLKDATVVMGKIAVQACAELTARFQ